MTSQNVGEAQIPQDLVSEKGLLSCLVQKPDLLSQAPINLFWNAAHRMIYEALERLVKNPKVRHIDFAVVKTDLSSRKQLEETGGVEYLNEVWGFCPAPSAWQWYHGNLEAVRLHREAVLGAFEIQNAETAEDALAAVEKLSKSQALVPGSIRHIKDVMQDTIDWLEGKAERKSRPLIKFGIPSLDEAILLEPGNVVVICAETGCGKTALSVQAVEESPKTKWAIFSLEMEAEAIGTRLLANSGRVRMNHLMSGRLEPYESSSASKSLIDISKRPIWIDDRQATIGQIANVCRQLQRSEGLDAIVVDYLQLIVPSNRKNDSREQQVAEISRSMKNLAKELKIVVVTMSQLNDDGKVRESRAIAQDADLVLRITEDAIVMPKHRNGPKIAVPVRFIGHYTRFEENKDARDSA